MPLRRFGLLVLALVIIGLLSMCGGGETVQVEGVQARVTCPECGSSVVHESNCLTCKHCGWSKC